MKLCRRTTDLCILVESIESMLYFGWYSCCFSIIRTYMFLINLMQSLRELFSTFLSFPSIIFADCLRKFSILLLIFFHFNPSHSSLLIRSFDIDSQCLFFYSQQSKNFALFFIKSVFYFLMLYHLFIIYLFYLYL